MKEIAAAFAGFSQEQIGEIVRCEGDYTLALPSGDVVLTKEDYEINSEDMPGWLVSSEGALTVALDIVQTPELIREGNARELIHPIQTLRKDRDLDVTDRIETVVYAGGEAYKAIEEALGEFGDYVAAQTLSLSVNLKNLEEAPASASEVEWDKDTIKIDINKK